MPIRAQGDGPATTCGIPGAREFQPFAGRSLRLRRLRRRSTGRRHHRPGEEEVTSRPAPRALSIARPGQSEKTHGCHQVVFTPAAPWKVRAGLDGARGEKCASPADAGRREARSGRFLEERFGAAGFTCSIVVFEHDHPLRFAKHFFGRELFPPFPLRLTRLCMHVSNSRDEIVTRSAGFLAVWTLFRKAEVAPL